MALPPQAIATKGPIRAVQSGPPQQERRGFFKRLFGG